MKKGISPLVASVLLIAITMAVAAILANWATTTTTQTLQASRVTCIGGNINYISADYPKIDSSRIKAVVEGQYIPLGDFKVEVIYNNDTLRTYDIVDEPTGGLAAGSATTLTSEVVGSSSDIKQVRITTNCSNVQTAWTALR